MVIILAILVVGAALIAYAMIEKRINLRPCPECGFKVSIDGLDEDCPRCGSLIPQVMKTEVSGK
jgi:ssDNA-binding Zn-finger/Zn-ribbon topoisomerase 1